MKDIINISEPAVIFLKSNSERAVFVGDAVEIWMAFQIFRRNI